VAEVHAAAVAYARTGGLRILAGTDAVLAGMHGRNYMELVHLVRDGLSPLQAWHGATGLAAAEIGQPDAGTIVRGQRADLLVCDADVVADPSLLDGHIVEVVKDGFGHRGLDGLPQRTYRARAWELAGGGRRRDAAGAAGGGA
jgi:imidazolonepropionase-like amidohydrolase